jgi:Ca-activated chloride channel family protein
MTLIRFAASDYIEHIVPFTSDKSALLNVTVDSFSAVGGQSAVLDAVYVSAEATAEHKPSDASFRRAVVLISDGEDRASFYSRSKVTNLLNEQNVQVFLIGMTTELTEDGGFIRRSPRLTAETLLTTVARNTGGRVFFPRNPKELFQAVNQIVTDLRSQYVVGFERNIMPGEKGYQKFKLKMAPTSPRPKLKIITKPGFWLSAPETKKKK